MTEWLTREDVDHYLDDRSSKGMTVVQLCLFWGKRTDRPLAFTTNPANAYGHKAFLEVDGAPDPRQPAIASGGSAMQPNDFWDHVDYCLQAIRQRGMYAAVLPFWGRRYLNASHRDHSEPVFNRRNIEAYGAFLSQRYQSYDNVIWVLGGDVKATEGGNHVDTYRAFAQALRAGGSDSKLLTYHPDGSPLVNSSTWFHHDSWLDFNMIETFSSVDQIAAAIRADRALEPPKPTILAEGDYEGGYDGAVHTDALRVRRQAYQSFFAGAAGFTYGGALDAAGNGPLFGPSNNWKPLLEWKGAEQMVWLRRFLETQDWPGWVPSPELIAKGRSEGSREKLAVSSGESILIYFPENDACELSLPEVSTAIWFNPANGRAQHATIDMPFQPPTQWEDAVLILK